MNFEKGLLAKSNPPESLKTHTQALLDRLDRLIKSGVVQPSPLIEVIKKIIFYHDMGKVSSFFQNKVSPSKLKTLPQLSEYPHEWLSLAFISTEDKKFFESFNANGVNFYELARFCIAFHHSRKQMAYDMYSLDMLKKHIELDLEPRKQLLGISYPLRNNYNLQSIREKINGKTGDLERFKTYFKDRVFLKGLLHKCDYTASAHITPEKLYTTYQADFSNWIANNNKFKNGLKKFQQDAQKIADQSVVLVASTGVGKTEFAMNWMNGDKSFYLLGIRMAVNAIYDRFSQIFDANNPDKNNPNVCLLHGESGTMLLDEDDITDTDYFSRQSKARLLSHPITIATADQLVPAVFKYNGFELIYFTCSYSKIVVDEIQSFSPKSMAAIVVFLKEIHRLGGRFLLMTATLPPFIKKEFEGLGVHFPEPELSSIKRHRFSLVEAAIDTPETIQSILQKSHNKSVLVICNTVKKAQHVYTELAQHHPTVHLLHSRFIGTDKAEKEAQIMADSKDQTKHVIWVTTQVVEASLDIDFDLLFTEMASVDSLFQRFGRCYRSREYTQNEPNILIYDAPETPCFIYDNALVNETRDCLKAFDNQLLTEENKQTIINQVFEQLSKNSNYILEYETRKKMLKLGFQADKSDAQQSFREITNQFSLIPKPIYDQNKTVIHDLIQSIDAKEGTVIERLKKAAELKKMMVGVQLYQMQQHKHIKEITDLPNSKYCNKNALHILHGCEYSQEKGVVLLKDWSDTEDRMI
jgi:CRISPR-associated endonuclease/helicase Cas3